jgi:hypothetical protein
MNILKQLRLFKKFYLTSRPANGPVGQQDFVMHSEPVDMRAYYRALDNSPLIAKTLATVSYKGRGYRILQLSLEGRPGKRLLVFAGVHGNEFAAALAVLDLLDDIRKHPDRYAGWNIRIVAPVNPVGLAEQSRYNEDGRDINRDFKHFRTVGGRVQRDAIEDFRPDVIVSLHESPEHGFFMFSEGRLPNDLKSAILAKLSAAAIPLVRKSAFHLRLRAGIWEKPRSIFWLQRVLGIHTLGSYAYSRSIPTITTETSWVDNNVEARRKPHFLVIQAIIST